MAYFKVVILILVSEVQGKKCPNTEFFLVRKFTGWINILKGIPLIFIIEEAKTTTSKFEDIFRCFN